MSVVLEPLSDNVIIRLRPMPTMTGSIHRVDRKEMARQGDVVSCGAEVRDVAPGQGVLFNVLAGQMVGEDWIGPESAILATL